MRSAAMVPLVVAAGGKVESGSSMPPCMIVSPALLVGMLAEALTLRGTSGLGPVYFRTQ